MMEKHGIIALVDADIAGIGNKARHLARLLKCQPELFAVPSGVVLLPTFSLDKDMACLHQTLSDMGEGLYAVRSCGLDEDGDHESMAGKFDTMLGVPACDLKQAIAQVRSSFTDVADTGSVLIQHMVNPDYAGVMFTQSIENAGLASCEFSLGVAEDLVSGKVKPTHVDYGRLSGALYPEQNQHQSMLDVLFLVGMTIEILMDEPQDVEWAYDAKHGQLYVLQSMHFHACLPAFTFPGLAIILSFLRFTIPLSWQKIPSLTITLGSGLTFIINESVFTHPVDGWMYW